MTKRKDRIYAFYFYVGIRYKCFGTIIAWQAQSSLDRIFPDQISPDVYEWKI